MFLLSPEQRTRLNDWFLPEQPGRLTGMHILNTGNGAVYADRWPDPQAVLADTAGSYVLLGNPTVLDPEKLSQRIRGSVYTSDEFVPLLNTTFPRLKTAQKTVSVLNHAPEMSCPVSEDITLRRLEKSDARFLWGLSPHSAWITRSWGGPAGLAESGQAWGAFVDNQLASVACCFYMGAIHRDTAVTTEPWFRGRGLSTLCAAALCRDMLASGGIPIWNASVDHPASLRVADKLGFEFAREYTLYNCLPS